MIIFGIFVDISIIYEKRTNDKQHREAKWVKRGLKYESHWHQTYLLERSTKTFTPDLYVTNTRVTVACL